MTPQIAVARSLVGRQLSDKFLIESYLSCARNLNGSNEFRVESVAGGRGSALAVAAIVAFLARRRPPSQSHRPQLALIPSIITPSITVIILDIQTLKILRH